MAVDELAPFVLTNVEGLHDSSQEREKGSGAYGVVYKVSVNGMPCIAKRLHAILTTGVSVRERDSIQAKFRNECIILSKLRHPNVVHFVGVCYDKTPDKISLIMERLHTDLSHVLDTQVDIPLPDKLSILLDVSYGLLYLHTSHPPIIHRDLTAPNILLTQDLRAKIADLGVSKLLSSQALAAHTQTKGPGQILYMPPEALTENPKYGTKLDVFSFGHMAIYVMTQEFPNVFEVPITVEILTQGTLQILKRQMALKKLGKDHCMYPLITQCLMDVSEKRPTTKDLNAKLVELKATHPKVETPVEIQDLQRQISSLRVDHQKKVSTLESSVAVSQRKVTSLESDLAFSQGKNTKLENYLAACQQKVTSLETDLAAAQKKATAVVSSNYPPQAAAGYPPQDPNPSVMQPFPTAAHPEQQFPHQAVPTYPEVPPYPTTHGTDPAQKDILGRLKVTIAQAKLVKNYGITRMDPYCRMRIGHSVYETPTAVNGGKNPSWNKIFSCNLVSGVPSAYIEISNERYLALDDRIAWAHYELPQSLFEGETIEEWIVLTGKQGDGKEGNLNVILSFTANARRD